MSVSAANFGKFVISESSGTIQSVKRKHKNMDDAYKKGIIIVVAGFVVLAFLIWLFFFSSVSIFS